MQDVHILSNEISIVEASVVARGEGVWSPSDVLTEQSGSQFSLHIMVINFSRKFPSFAYRSYLFDPPASLQKSKNQKFGRGWDRWNLGGVEIGNFNTF